MNYYYGLYRSGTNLLEYMLKTYTNIDLVGSHDKYIDKETYKHVSKCDYLTETSNVVVIYKTVNYWIPSARRYKRTENCGIGYWASWHRDMIDNLEKTGCNFRTLDYKAFVDEPQSIMDKLIKMMNCEYTTYPVTIPGRKLGRGNELTKETFHPNTDIEINITEEVRDVQSRLEEHHI